MFKILKTKVNKFFMNLLTKWLEDLFILIGITVIILTTYKEFGNIMGNYLLGFILLIFGFLFAKK